MILRSFYKERKIDSMLEFKGKRALVTGSSRGIGKEIALDLAKNGAEVLVHCASNIAKAENVCNEIISFGGNASVVNADLSSEGGIDKLTSIMGNVDILVLNASIQIKNKWDNITTEEFVSQVNCNFLASFKLIQQAVPFMKQNNWGRIITIGSVQEAKPHPDMLVYSATKAAQTNMVQSLSLQLAKDGITVNNVAPGVIYTDRNIEALSDTEYAKKVARQIPVGFYGKPKDCAPMVRLLASEDGRYITGQSIYIDGGKSL